VVSEHVTTSSTPFSWSTIASNITAPLLLNHPLQRLTSWRVGGAGEAVLIPSCLEDVSVALRLCPEALPVTWLGLGSNVLIADSGVKGLVIVTQGSALCHMEIIAENIIYAQAGVPCGQLARFSARHDLQGLEFLAGIPGTLGGALRMNAGCYGGETWDHVTHVETIDRRGVRHQYQKEAFDIRYRYVSLSDDQYFLGAYFKLSLGSKEQSLLKIKTMLDQRNRSQPTHLPNCGSVFKNPVGYHAAALIEGCGLKGQRVGGAQISEKHANFIVNVNDASSADILELITLAKNEVNKKFGIQLQQEVRII